MTSRSISPSLSKDPYSFEKTRSSRGLPNPSGERESCLERTRRVARVIFNTIINLIVATCHRVYHYFCPIDEPDQLYRNEMRGLLGTSRLQGVIRILEMKPNGERIHDEQLRFAKDEIKRKEYRSIFSELSSEKNLGVLIQEHSIGRSHLNEADIIYELLSHSPLYELRVLLGKIRVMEDGNALNHVELGKICRQLKTFKHLAQYRPDIATVLYEALWLLTEKITPDHFNTLLPQERRMEYRAKETFIQLVSNKSDIFWTRVVDEMIKLSA